MVDEETHDKHSPQHQRTGLASHQRPNHSRAHLSQALPHFQAVYDHPTSQPVVYIGRIWLIALCFQLFNAFTEWKKKNVL